MIAASFAEWAIGYILCVIVVYIVLWVTKW